MLAKSNLYYFLMSAVVSISPMAAKANNADCLEYLGREEFELAIAPCTAAAEQGDDAAQTNLGMMYNEGLGVAQNYNEAMRWYRAAAIQGNEIAQLFIAFLYERGQGVPVDNVSAMMWFNIAAHDNNKLAEILRDEIVLKLTDEEIAEAQSRALQCLDSNFSDC
jgi:uncharacterized protein